MSPSAVHVIDLYKQTGGKPVTGEMTNRPACSHPHRHVDTDRQTKTGKHRSADRHMAGRQILEGRQTGRHREAR